MRVVRMADLRIANEARSIYCQSESAAQSSTSYQLITRIVHYKYALAYVLDLYNDVPVLCGYRLA